MAIILSNRERRKSKIYRIDEFGCWSETASRNRAVQSDETRRRVSFPIPNDAPLLHHFPPLSFVRCFFHSSPLFTPYLYNQVVPLPRFPIVSPFHSSTHPSFSLLSHPLLHCLSTIASIFLRFFSRLSLSLSLSIDRNLRRLSND